MKWSLVTMVLVVVVESRTPDKAITDQAVSPKPTFLSGLSLWPTITVSKFPPIIEFIAQRIQTQFSNYVHEDLSRPQTYDRPVYTLSPADLERFTSTTETPTATEDPTTTEFPYTTEVIDEEEVEEYEELEEEDATTKRSSNTIVEFIELVNSPEFNSSIEIEYELRKVVNGGGTVEGAYKGNSLYVILNEDKISEKPKIKSDRPNLNSLEHVVVIKSSGGEYKVLSDIQKKPK